MVSPFRKEEPMTFARRWAGDGDRGLVAAVAPAVTTVVRPVKLVTLKVQDAQRRLVARTMRRTDKLQGLMDYYYDMCPAGAGAGAGRFVFDGKRLRGEQTPEELGMKGGDRIDFFTATDRSGDVEEEAAAADPDRKPSVKPAAIVHLTLRVRDTQRRTVERTVGRTQKLQLLMDAYYASVPDVARGTGKFLYNGGQLTGEQTPAGLKMERDEDEIEIDFFADMLGGGRLLPVLA